MIISGEIIGVDESGKGDFFGPLVVAGVLAGEADLPFFDDIGVRDSKKLSDKRCLEIDERLRARCLHHVEVLMPAEYNSRYDDLRNLNILLAEGHATAISSVLQQSVREGRTVDLAISDKFGKTERLETALARANCRVPLRQMVRGEAVPQVAAASIMARAEFIRSIDQLSDESGLTLPKGAAAQVDAVGRQLVAQSGVEILTKFAKLHFKNYKRATATDMFKR